MIYTTLISPSDLLPHVEDPNWVIVDARFALADPARGGASYLESHIPGAVYAHLDEDLSGPVTPGITGRHPLPAVEDTAQAFSRLGIGPGVQVVAYDDLGGALAAARVWWLLNWLGHPQAAVLDGGWQRWQQEGLPVRSGLESRRERRFIPNPQPQMVVSSVEVDQMRADPAYRVIDSRSADRFRGENETIDPVAGHIPGAISGPYAGNLTKEGVFQAPERLKSRFERFLEDRPAEKAVFYCGSGVTAAHNVLALKHAGLGDARLYAGSWSEWITDPHRPVATGPL